MVSAYQSAEDWYPVTLVKTLIKKGKADVNKESDCCRDEEKNKCCWSPLMSAGYHGNGEILFCRMIGFILTLVIASKKLILDIRHVTF